MRVFFVKWPDRDKAGWMLAPDPATAAHRSLRGVGVDKADREHILAGEHVRAAACRPYRVPEAMSADGEAQAKFLPEPIAKKLALEPCSAVEAFAALPDETLIALCRTVWPGAKAKARVPAVHERQRSGRTRRPMSSATRLQAIYALTLALLEPGFAEGPWRRSEAVSALTGTTVACEGCSVAPAGALAP